MDKSFSLNDCYCSDPQVIINPKLPELLIKYGVFYTPDGRRHYCRPGQYAIYDFPWYLFKPGDLVTMEDIKNCVVVDEKTGETFPIWFLVPCGHCDLCQNLKVRRFCNKCVMESQLYDCDPIHMVLTYDNSHLPIDGNVCYEDVCKFKKRFRINLFRAGYTSPIRMVDSSEYGDKKGRPHYHLLIWNLNCMNKVDFYNVLRIAYYSWRKCRFHVLKNGFKLVNQDYIPKGQTKSLREMGIPSDRVFEYVGAYIGNPQNIPGKAKTWVHCSKGKLGGIGAPFLDKHMRQIQRQKYHGFKFRERTSGKLKELIYDRYVLNRCFPSKYTSIPYKLRRAVKDYAEQFPLLPENSRWRFTFDRIYERFNKHFFIPILDITDIPSYHYTCKVSCPAVPCIAEMICELCWSTIYKYMDIDYSYVHDLDNTRHVVLAKFFEHPRDRDRVIEVYKNNLRNSDRVRKRNFFKYE